MQRITNKYSLTSPAFSGEVFFEFDLTTGNLLVVDVQAELSRTQHIYLFSKLPQHIAELDSLKTGSGSAAKITKIKIEVTFDDFWKRYGLKDDKKVAQRRWSGLTVADRIKAFNYITRYEKILADNPTRQKMLPSTYLNKERWND
jgi:hypothetical protein